MANRLREVGDGAAGPRVGFDDQHLAILDDVLDIYQAPDTDRLGEFLRVVVDPRDHAVVQAYGRHYRGAVPRVDAGCLDVLHDPGHHGRGAVTQGVDIDLGGAGNELVDQYRRLVRQLCIDLFEVGLQLLIGVHYHHRPAAQDVGGTHHHRVADLVGQLLRLLRPARHPSLRHGDPEAGAE